MRNFIGAITNKSIWTFILLLIACWSAFAFYKAGFAKATTLHSQTITEQQQEIIKLRNMLLIERQIHIRGNGPIFQPTIY